MKAPCSHCGDRITDVWASEQRGLPICLPCHDAMRWVTYRREAVEQAKLDLAEAEEVLRVRKKY